MPRTTDQPVLVCFDGSAEAAGAIARAGAFFPRREALVLTVAVRAEDELALDPISDFVGRRSGIYRDWNHTINELAESQAQTGCELASRAGLKPRPLIRMGKPADTILRVAKEHDVAAIVVGAPGPGHHHRLLGTVTQRVVHGTGRPVLVVPASDTAPPQQARETTDRHPRSRPDGEPRAAK